MGNGRHRIESAEEFVAFKKKELSGSRLRCLMLTACPPRQFASILSEVVVPIATISESDVWTPKGFLHPEEAKFGECDRFLAHDVREALTSWWLRVRRNANTPNWDLVSTCTIEGKQGLIIVEAKAHSAEAKMDGKDRNGNPENHDQIGLAIAEANAGLNGILTGFALSRDTHYQLCNRFAWAWKLASLGVPTVLVYLGFLDADEMASRSQQSFGSSADWERHIRDHSSKIIPAPAWERRLQTNCAPMWPIIRSLKSEWIAGKHGMGAQACP